MIEALGVRMGDAALGALWQALLARARNPRAADLAWLLFRRPGQWVEKGKREKGIKTETKRSRIETKKPEDIKLQMYDQECARIGSR